MNTSAHIHAPFRILGVSLAGLAACVMADRPAMAQCVEPPVTLTEAQFGSWSIIRQFGTNPGSASGGAFASDGFPAAPSYESFHGLATTPAQTTILVCHSGAAAVYDPAASGAIATINWKLRYRWVNGSCCAGQEYALLAVQRGVVYAADAFLTLESGAWLAREVSGLTALNFEPAPFQGSPPAHPDFSASGASIQFGVLTSNSTAADGTGYVTRTRFDTWAVEIQPAGCAADFNCDGFVSGDDFDGYVAAFELGDEAADFNGDGFVSGDDFDLFVTAFEAGC